MLKSGMLAWGLAAVLLASMGTEGEAAERQRTLPARYDYREAGRDVPVKNQGSLGTCWAFASLTALETSLPEESREDLSEDHMSLWDRFPGGQADGGDYIMAMAYLLSWEGPVAETEDAYGDGKRTEDGETVGHVQEIRLCPPKDYERIKEAVYETGGVQSCFYSNLVWPGNDTVYYNSRTASYYCDQEREANHDVVIVGWDDNYPRENFRKQPEGDGAFLCVNSWGKDFGEEGYFYISYYDANIGTANVSYTLMEETDNYSHIYQTDLGGWVGQVGYGKDTAWFSNVYTAGGRENLEAVGFYATGPGTEYEVWVVRNAAGAESLANRTLAAAGSFEDAGYYTVALEQPVPLKKGERFAVAVKIRTPGKVHPVAMEYDPGDGRRNVDLTDGEGYISYDGKSWFRAEEEACNVCLKAYTADR